MLLQNTCLFVTISKISLEMKIPIHLLQKTDIKYFHLFYFVCTKFVFRVCLLFYLFYWSIVDLQCFRYTAKWLGYIYVCMYIVPSDSVMSNSLWPYGLYPHESPLSMGFFQARILEQVAISSSRGSSWPRDQTQVSRIAGRFFPIWATREAQEYWSWLPFPPPGDLPDPGIETASLVSTALAGGFFTTGKPLCVYTFIYIYVCVCVYIYIYI